MHLTPTPTPSPPPLPHIETSSYTTVCLIHCHNMYLRKSYIVACTHLDFWKGALPLCFIPATTLHYLEAKSLVLSPYANMSVSVHKQSVVAEKWWSNIPTGVNFWNLYIQYLQLDDRGNTQIDSERLLVHLFWLLWSTCQFRTAKNVYRYSWQNEVWNYYDLIFIGVWAWYPTGF